MWTENEFGPGEHPWHRAGPSLRPICSGSLGLSCWKGGIWDLGQLVGRHWDRSQACIPLGTLIIPTFDSLSVPFSNHVQFGNPWAPNGFRFVESHYHPHNCMYTHGNTIHCGEHDIWHIGKHASRTVIVQNLLRQPHSPGRPSHAFDGQHLSAGAEANPFMGWTMNKDNSGWFMLVRIPCIPRARSLDSKFFQVMIERKWMDMVFPKIINGDPVFHFSPAEFLRCNPAWIEIGPAVSWDWSELPIPWWDQQINIINIYIYIYI